jgi:RNA polymerase sigma factor (TIGR02999 family)
MRDDSVTKLLLRVQEGAPDAVDDLFGLVYDEMTALARRQRARWHGNDTLNTTALVHEAYLKLVDQERIGVEGRAHFFALAARAMRHILSNYARDQRRQKRGGSYAHVSVEDVQVAASAGELTLTDGTADTLVALDEALARLEQVSPRQSRVVECRFYGQMTVPETAAALDISPATVKRDWAVAQAWLHREVQRELHRHE